MIQQEIINTILSIEAAAEQLRQKCYSARKKLGSVYSPAPKGGKNKLTETQITELLNKRRKNILRNVK